MTAFDIAQLSDVGQLTKDQRIALLKELAALEPEMAVSTVKTAVAERSEKDFEEQSKWFDTAKADLVTRFKVLLAEWIAANNVEDFKFTISTVVVENKAVKGEVEMKAARKTGGVISGKPAAARDTQSLAAYIGAVSSIKHAGVVYDSWEKLRVALDIPMPPRESATRTLVKVATGKAGVTESGGVIITQTMIDNVRDVEIVAVTVSGSLGEIADAIKSEKKNGKKDETTAPAAAVNPTA
ncbi:MAG: hypothetical protein NUW37_14795 [Planctomycetes bacterium]|nr:hypothetical protein [Planctomycetota bacterium]